MKTYTIYKLIETNEGRAKNRNDYRLTDNIEETKKEYQRLNDSMMYDKYYYIEVIKTLKLSKTSYEAFKYVFTSIYLKEV